MSAQQTVLVTGAFGNVGRYTVRLLLEQGYRVVATDVQSPASEKAAKASPPTPKTNTVRDPQYIHGSKDIDAATRKALKKRIEDAKVRLRIAAGGRRPLPAAVIRSQIPVE